MKITITKEFKWDCAHKLYDTNLTKEENEKIFGKCSNLHGHTYKLFVTISSENNKLSNGMIMNFNDLKYIVEKYIIDRFDHKCLNDDELYKNRLSTCENQIVDIWQILETQLFNLDLNLKLEKIKLYETPTSFAEMTR